MANHRKSTYDDYAWDAHWSRVGVKPGGEFDTPDETEVAIEVLVEAGYSLMDEEDNKEAFEAIDFAQTYLTLAFRHCPRLMDIMPKVQPTLDVLISQATVALQYGRLDEAHDLIMRARERREIDARRS